MDNKGWAAVITLDTTVVLPSDYSGFSAEHSGLSPRPGRGGGRYSLSLEPARMKGSRA